MNVGKWIDFLINERLQIHSPTDQEMLANALTYWLIYIDRFIDLLINKCWQMGAKEMISNTLYKNRFINQFILPRFLINI